MAKSKKSRRVRRQEIEKQRQQGESKVAVATEVSKETESESQVVKPVAPESVQRKAVDFAKEYFYVYTDLRSMLIIAAVLLVVMIGALYVI